MIALSAAPLAPTLAALASGALIGTILSVLGAGGSILAVPLLIAAVGITDPHVAIGTAAAAVALNASIALWRQTRMSNVRWPCGLLFALAGVCGAWAGTLLGKAMNGQKLLILFGMVMVLVGIASMRRGTDAAVSETVRLTRRTAATLSPRLAVAGLSTGVASGFFGIGGGFLIVPSLMVATGMAMPLAMGTSLVAVAGFGFTALASYAASGWVDWGIAAWMSLGGLIGVGLGTRAARSLHARRLLLSRLFSGLVIASGAFVIWKGLPALGQ
jgi:hypothetical protein